ncbi:MAG TPA: hypothetical protein VHZ73_13325, partial [Vicinamibacterales bacterium]|nr:hypothetical protein [Vicinamibacterales bacterium]
RDGDNNNNSWNSGVEGPSDDVEIKALRARQVRNFLTTLLLSQGVPMISHGDEMGRTQQGNNNAYCQDSEITWIDWDLDDERKALCDFTAELIRFRLSEPALRRRKYFQGRSLRGVKDLAWLTPDAGEMNDEAWASDFVRCVGMLLSGDAIEEVDEKGEVITGDTLLVLFNAHSDEVPFAMPALESTLRWQRVVDTMEAHAPDASFSAGERYPLHGRSVAVFRRASVKKDRRLNAPAAKAAEPAPEPIGAV